MATAYLNDEIVVKEAQRRLQAYLPIDWEGNWYNAMDAWMTLLGAVSMHTSMAAMCREGQEAPSDNTLREKLDEQGWDDRLIEAACNDILAQSVRQCSWLGAFPVVIDLHETPFYGQAPKDDADVIRRGKAKAGTTSFHTFATAYVRRRHRRFTLALTRVRAHESMLEVADRLRQRVEALDIHVQVYLLDRQFWTYELLAAWQEIPYIMPIRRTGKSGTDGGTRPLFDLRESQFLTYTMSPKPQEPLDITVAVVVLPETRKERQARLAKAKIACENAQQRVDDKAKALDDNATAQTKRALTCANKALAKAQARLEEERVAQVMTTLCYAINRVANWSLKRIYSTYRGRFGIESSYRQSHQARLFTTSRKPWFRLLGFGLSMMLRNLWLEVRWLLGEPQRGRGGRQIAKGLLPFPMFVRWLAWAAWKALRFKTWLYPQTGLPNPLWEIP
jgi:hypothetical protein